MPTDTETKAVLVETIANVAKDEKLAAGTPLTDLKLDQVIAEKLLAGIEIRS